MKFQKLLFKTFVCALGFLLAQGVHAQNKVWYYAGNYTQQGYMGDTYLAWEPNGSPVRLNEPGPLAFDAAGNLFIGDAVPVIRRVDGATHIITTAIGNYHNYVAPFSRPSGVAAMGPGGPSASVSMGTADGLAYNAMDNCIYVAERTPSVIFKVNLSTNQVTTVAGDPNYISTRTGGQTVGYTYSGDGGPAINAGFSFLGNIAISTNGRYLYAVDWNSFVIRKIDLLTNIITTFAGNGLNSIGAPGDGGPATAASIGNVNAITVDTANNVYLSANIPTNSIFSQSSIRKVDAVTGIISTILGGDNKDYHNYQDGLPATSLNLSISALVYDKGSNSLLFAAGDRNSTVKNFGGPSGPRIRSYNLSTQAVGTVVGDYGSSSNGFIADGINAINGGANFQSSYGLAINPVNGKLYVSDLYARQVYQISPGAPVVTPPVVPVNATGTIDCNKTMLIPAPVAGIARQLDLVVTVNATTAGCFSPLSISGSGFSLSPGFTQKCVTSTGVQQLHIPVNYDGSALGGLSFTIGAAGTCTADLTKLPVKKEINVWTLDNCTFVNAAPALK